MIIIISNELHVITSNEPINFWLISILIKLNMQIDIRALKILNEKKTLNWTLFLLP